MNAANQIIKGPTLSAANLPVIPKQTGIGDNDTRDSINVQENSTRRSSQGGFSIKRPKLGEPDFDYSYLNMNLRYLFLIQTS